MVKKGKLVICLILFELVLECSGKWCNVTEEIYLWDKKEVNVTKRRPEKYKCGWFNKSNCIKYVPYTISEIRSVLVPKNVTKQECCNGYTDEMGQCIPICETFCSNARCVAPNTCRCNNGYKIFSEEAPHKCIPHCDNCDFGSCIAPDKCICASGYREDNFEGKKRCVPICKEGCPPRSICTQPDNCTCLAEFTEVFIGEQMKCVVEGETEAPPTESSTVASTTTEEIPEDSTDYSEIEEVPEEDPGNSTLPGQLDEADNDLSLEIVSDDPWKNILVNYSHSHEEIKEEKNDKFLYSVLGKVWYSVLAILVIVGAIIALKIYIAIERREYKIPHEAPTEVVYASKL